MGYGKQKKERSVSKICLPAKVIYPVLVKGMEETFNPVIGLQEWGFPYCLRGQWWGKYFPHTYPPNCFPLNIYLPPVECFPLKLPW